MAMRRMRMKLRCLAVQEGKTILGQEEDRRSLGQMPVVMDQRRALS
jgi:hypothetical protein